MGVEILLPETEPVDARGNQVQDGVLDALGITMIDRTVGEVLEDARAQVHLAQDQASRIGSDITAIKTGNNFGPNCLGEREGRGGTLYSLSPRGCGPPAL